MRPLPSHGPSAQSRRGARGLCCRYHCCARNTYSVRWDPGSLPHPTAVLRKLQLWLLQLNNHRDNNHGCRIQPSWLPSLRCQLQPLRWGWLNRLYSWKPQDSAHEGGHW